MKINKIIIFAFMLILLSSFASATIDWNNDVNMFLPLANVTNSTTGLLDLTSNNNDGTAYNGVTFTNSSQNSFDFDGTGDYISTPTTLTNKFSISQWVKFNTVGATINSFYTTIETTDRDGFNFLKFNNNKLLMNIYKSNSAVDYIYSTKDDFAINTWYNIVLTYDTGVAKIYINGVSDANKTVVDFITNDFSLMIAKYRQNDITVEFI